MAEPSASSTTPVSITFEKEKALPSAVPEGKEDTLTYSLRHLAAFDISPISKKDNLAAVARDNIQFLVNKVFALPQAKSEEGPLAILPPESEGFRLPREKPLPKKKVQTRWERFAQEKGIVKQKRGRMVFDEVSKDWVPRWGYKSIKSSTRQREDAIIENAPGQNPYHDPFELRAAERQLLKAKQKAREIRNQVEGLGRKMPQISAPDLAAAKQGRRGKEGLSEALRRAQTSTRSVGKFDRTAKGERDLRSKRQKVSHSSTTEERAQHLKVADKILSGGGMVDKRKAGKAGLRQEHEQNASNKKAGKIRQKEKPSGRRSKAGVKAKGGRNEGGSKRSKGGGKGGGKSKGK